MLQQPPLVAGQGWRPKHKLLPSLHSHIAIAVVDPSEQILGNFSNAQNERQQSQKVRHGENTWRFYISNWNSDAFYAAMGSNDCSGRLHAANNHPQDNCAIDACLSKEDALQLWDELHYWSGYLKRRKHCDAHLLYMQFEREILNLHSDDDAKAFMLEHKGTDYATEVEHATGAATFRYAIGKLYDEGLCMRKCEVLYLILLMNRADNLKLATKRVNALLGLFEQMAIKTNVGKEPDYNALKRGMGCLWVELGDDFKPGAPCAGTSLEMWEYEMEHLKANIF